MIKITLALWATFAFFLAPIVLTDAEALYMSWAERIFAIVILSAAVAVFLAVAGWVLLHIWGWAV